MASFALFEPEGLILTTVSEYLIRRFCKEPVANRPVRATVGFDVCLGYRLENAGFSKVIDVFIKYLRCNRNKALYGRWLRMFTAEEDRINYSYQFFDDWCNATLNRQRSTRIYRVSVAVQTI